MGSETYKNPDSSSLQKPPVAGLVTMGRLQLSKEEEGRLVLVLRRTGKGPEDYDFLPAKV